MLIIVRTNPNTMGLVSFCSTRKATLLIMNTYIYALIDPRTTEIRYIGKTDTPSVRQRGHLHPSALRFTTRKINWIKSLISKKLSPQLVLIDEVSLADWAAWEQFYIALFKELGFPLTNTTDGGEGWQTGHGHSEETKRKISRAKMGQQPRLGMLHSAASKLKISITKTGQKYGPWTQEHKQHYRHAKLGVKLSIQHKLSLSHAKAGKSSKRIFKNKSGFRGVVFDKQRNLWQSHITCHSKGIYLGRFAIKEEAARAYDAKALELFGAGCYLNFPVVSAIQC